MRVETVCRMFGVEGNFMGQKKVSSGNINTTYTAVFRDAAGQAEEYVVQKINGYVFKNPTQIMSNIALVTEHIKKKLLACGEDPTVQVLQFLHGADGKNFYQDNESNVWRVYHFIPNSVAFDATNDLNVLRNAGAAFGQFQKNLLDFDASQLYETISDFHNTPKRLDTLFASVERDEYGRVAEAKELIDYIAEKRKLAGQLMERAQAGELPLRVTHNDTKCNNVLFDKNTGRELAVIDLDTIMPGLMAYDFGDAVRFAANTAAEDEKDLSKVSLNLERFTAFAEGFVGNLGDTMTQAELDSMALGTFSITIELAARFLNDYLTGDKYFAVHYPGHNLDRAACQVALAKDMERKMDQMREIVYTIARKSK